MAKKPTLYTLYTVASATTLDALCGRVMSMMNDGWQPQGGLLLTPSGEFLQALVK